jgi:flavin-dependent dehydrogenase
MSEFYDVIVVGGGAAGVGAAVGASLAGARTALLERGPYLGGAATLRNVTTYCGLYSCSDQPEQVVFGVAERVLAGLRAEGAVSEPIRANAVYVNVDPEAVKRTLDTVCEDAGVEILLHTTVVAAHRDADAGRITRGNGGRRGRSARSDRSCLRRHLRRRCPGGVRRSGYPVRL